MKIENISPENIEKKSFEILTSELEEKAQRGEIPPLSSFDPDDLSVIKRCIHTTADLDYINTLKFSEGAFEKAVKLIRSGAIIVTDTNMALAGINKKELARYGCGALCFMADEEVAKEAKERGLTRAAVSMEKAMGLGENVIFVVGNAPTALVTLKENADRGIYHPAFVIAVPVGFVNVVAAKNMILESDIAHIVNAGRKGGSNVAAAIVNSILYRMRDEG